MRTNQAWQQGGFYARAAKEIGRKYGMTVDEYISSDLPIMYQWCHGANALRFAKRHNLCRTGRHNRKMYAALEAIVGYPDHSHKWNFGDNRVRLITCDLYCKATSYLELPGYLEHQAPGYKFAYLPGEFAHNEGCHMYALWREDDVEVTTLIEKIKLLPPMPRNTV